MNHPENPYESPVAESAPEHSPRRTPFRLYLGRSLPQVCALCGQPAVTERSIRFLWPAFNEITQIVPHRETIDQEQASVPLPLCYAHRSFRRWWPVDAAILLWSSLVVLAVLFVANRQRPVLLVILAALLILVSVSLLVTLIKRALCVRASRIGATEVSLIGIAPKFAEAYGQMYRNETKPIDDFLDQIQGSGENEGGE